LSVVQMRLTDCLFSVIYFWISVLALCLAPFIFNPHQFSFSDFIIDYREYLRWMSRGNSRSHANSWIGYCRLSRTRITGFKKKRLGHPSEKLSADVPRASWRVIILGEIIGPICVAVILTTAYLFVKSFQVPAANGLLRIAVIAFGPILWNATLLLVLFFVSLFAGPLLAGCCARFGSIIAAVAHVGSVVGLVAFFEFLWYLEVWDTSHAVLGMIAVISIQRAVFKILISLFISREFKHDETNRAWWTGRWYGRGLGAHALSQPVREFVVKLIESSLFAADFLTAHFLLFMLTVPMIIPFVDRLHSTMLFWLRPGKQIRAPIYSFKQRAQRRKIVFKYTIVYLCVLAFFVALIVLPIIFRSVIDQQNCTICQSI
jgi:1,3-beta-glucan synthase